MTNATKFGILMFPMHLPGQSPQVLFQENLELVEHADRLGIDEVWVGEHHSSGVEIVAAPEMFLAAAAQRTQRIKLATGVSTVPYHNPLTLAGRMATLDHLSQGRAIMGMGPGQLTADAHMLGINAEDLRARLLEGAGPVTRLLRGETVTEKTDWYNLQDAHLQIRPYNPDFEMVAAAAVSPSGPRLAGRYGLGMINFAAGTQAGFEGLRNQWSIAEEEAERYGQTVSRSGWRMMCNVHIAESKKEAIRDIDRGNIRAIYDYISKLSIWEPIEAKSTEEWIEKAAYTGIIIGTPDEVVERVKALQEETGGFGGFIAGVQDFAPLETKKRSLDLYARYVIPEITGQLDSIRHSAAWSVSRSSQWKAEGIEVLQKAAADYEAHKRQG